MKKRLRKKKHFGEFTKWGRQLVITLNRKDALGPFFDAFLEEAIEPNGCYCFGGGSGVEVSVIVELGRRSENPEAKMKAVITWVDARPDVESWRMGEEFDVWHGDLHDIMDEIEQTTDVNKDNPRS